MTNQIQNPNDRNSKPLLAEAFLFRHSYFGHWDLIRHSSFEFRILRGSYPTRAAATFAFTSASNTESIFAFWSAVGTGRAVSTAVTSWVKALSTCCCWSMRLPACTCL